MDVSDRLGIIQAVTWDPDQLRADCADVASRARFVRVNTAAISAYAKGFGDNPPYTGVIAQHPAVVTAEWLILDAINFGSGWFPTLRKRPGLSGYRTIAAGLQERSRPWSANELTEITANELARTLGQDPDHPLVALFVASLRDLGRHIATDYAGSFEAAIAAAHGEAVQLVNTLASWECFADVSTYDGISLPFLKRAQIAAADLHRAGAAHFTDLQRLTIFADNLVPHVLALDGVLTLDPQLQAAIASEELLQHGSAPEVELRACAIHACELLVAAVGPERITAAELDGILWERGGEPRYKAKPRPRCRTTAY